MCSEELLLPVHTADKRLLLPTGTLLTRDVMEELAVRGQASHRNSCISILDHGSVKKDFLSFINQPPYQVIFADRAQNAAILKIMAEVRQPLPVLQALDYFRHYDFHTYRHMLMIFGLSMLVAWELIPDERERLRRAVASPTHDIGKIFVPLNILLKREPLTKTESRILKQHTLAGSVLLTYYLGQSQELAIRVARDHHERRNGIGYPGRIRQSDPLVEIVSVCDVYDALISPRPYRPVSFDNRTALEEITAMAVREEIGWDVVRALIALNRHDKPHYSEFEVSLEKRGTPPPGNSYGIVAEEGTTPEDSPG